ncbi:MAG: replicative DNA helicase [Deltaproteobacteria bacterium]|nr:MAG: replicative DNA helicase [Deltaproteobacteria bacterium]
MSTSGNTSSVGRVPPHNIEAEVSVLGAILLNNDTLSHVSDFLSKEDFYRTGHQIIYGIMQKMSDRGEPIDIVTLVDALRAGELLERIGGAPYISDLTGQVPSLDNAVHHAKIVERLAALRRLIQTALTIADEGYQSANEVDEYLDRAEQAIFDAASQDKKSDTPSMNQLVRESLKKLEDLFSRKEMITGVPSGFYDLDDLMAGLQPSDLVIVAGRPGMGKTSFVLNIAQHAAGKEGIPVAFFSLEMSKEQLVMRMLSSEARINSQSLRRGMLSAQDWPKLSQAAGVLAETPIFIDDTPAISTMELRAKARRLFREHKIGLLIVDYLQLMRGNGKHDMREQEISEISRSLKGLAKELNIPVVALSQLNRGVEQRPNKRPLISDLRESGAIEQDADVIMFVYREEVYTRQEMTKRGDDSEIPADVLGKAEIIVGKQRHGPTGDVNLLFDGKYTRFANLDRNH